MPISDNSLMPASIRQANSSIFHYTSSQGLLGIVDAKYLWASEAEGLNDLAEIRQGWEAIRGWLEAQPQTRVTKMLLRFATDPLLGKRDVFVLSASTAGDDANQWRLYADDGKGYVVELNSSIQLAAVSHVEAAPVDGDGDGFAFTPVQDVVAVTPWLHVLYTRPEFETALAELVAVAEAEDCRIQASAASDEFLEHHYDDFQDRAFDALATIAHLIKAPGFSGEHEVRVVATFMWGNGNDHINYRPGAYGVVGYAELTQAPASRTWTVLRPPAGTTRVAGSLPVKSVRLGPLLRPEHTKTVAALLRKSGLMDAEVEISTVPLR